MREQLTDYLSIDVKGKSTFYLKSAAESYYSRRPDVEYSGYKQLAPFLRMPRTKLVSSPFERILVVQGIDSPAVNTLLSTNPEAAKKGLVAFLADVEKMWCVTAKPMKRDALSRDWQTESIKTIINLLEDPRIQEVANLPLEVNSVLYPSINKTLNDCLTKLIVHEEKTMVLCHGDEHPANILSDGNDYWAIDPGNYTGYNLASSTVNNMVGGLYLFEYEYHGSALKKDNLFQIQYTIKDMYKVAEQILKPTLQELAVTAQAYAGESSISKELLFINELRVALGWTHRAKDQSEILKAGMVYSGLATEHYYSKTIV